MDNGLTQREAGELLADVKYLKACCDAVQKDIDSAKTRSTTTLTTVIILLVGVVVNLALTLSKYAK